MTTDNSTHPVVKEGVITIDADDQTSLKLHDVYLVPCLSKNLVFVPQIVESGKYVLFGPNDVNIIDNVKGIFADILFSGKKKGSLFVMTAGEAYVKKTSQTDNAAIWHARLGHVGYQLLQQICSKGLVDGILSLKNIREDMVCQGCQKGWKCMDPQTKKFTTSRDVVFDEVSTTFPSSKPVILDDNNSECLFSEINTKTVNDDETEKQNSSDNGKSNEQVPRRSGSNV
ncbi:Integrase, catalytic core [Senna tora]|uniref:Integrase, catalytic core n=1 Tax=Senna tora TaxID=362788 RepID=A0A834TMK5_9FABA|nr:Integrase, catalytic core [Senna tora]